VSISNGSVGSGYVWTSTDNGETWSSLVSFTGRSRAITVNPGNTADIYAGVEESIYRSTDSGANWSLYRTNVAEELVVVLHFDALIQGTTSGLYLYTKDTDVKDEDDDETLCFVATVCLYSKSHPKSEYFSLTYTAAHDLFLLRRFRERCLKRYALGRLFIRYYEKYGSYLAKAIAHREKMKLCIRVILVKPLVCVANEFLSKQYMVRILLCLCLCGIIATIVIDGVRAKLYGIG
jgi:hypothetical protein